MTVPQDGTGSAPYRVLARKYRPERFADLIGQEALVRTLGNAIRTGRVAQAFIFTGVRGVGKTTTARIIARALNCIGPEGDLEQPAEEPCGLCEHCLAIAEDRHVDVIEMDAASRTGIDDVREIIESVRYRPVQARRKVYIIDEVHMLSRQAFNGLLKTLEEPPEHVVFIFATTEIRKVPVTVLSRCQRFDLRRVAQDELEGHFTRVCEKEGVEAETEGLVLIARAADGSVRDGLSLLDQAVALGNGKVQADQVQAMLGLADRGRVLDLLDHLLAGRLPEALALLDTLYAAGADPAVVLQDLLELTHETSRVKVEPANLESLPIGWRQRLAGMAEKLSVADLTRCWQILLKGYGETQRAPRAREAAEMTLIRLGYASRLPTPGDLVRRLEGAAGKAEPVAKAELGAKSELGAKAEPAGTASGPGPTDRAPPAGPAAHQEPGPAAPSRNSPTSGVGALALAAAPDMQAPETRMPETRMPEIRMPESPPDQAVSVKTVGPQPEDQSDPALDPEAQPTEPETTPAQPSPAGAASPLDLTAVEALARDAGAMRLANHIRRDLHLVRFEPGRLEFRPGPDAPAQLAGQIARLLEDMTGRRWMVSVSSDPGAASLHEQGLAVEEAKREAVLQHPLVLATIETFPEARFVARRDKQAVVLPPDPDQDPNLEAPNQEEDPL